MAGPTRTNTRKFREALREGDTEKANQRFRAGMYEPGEDPEDPAIYPEEDEPKVLKRARKVKEPKGKF